MAGRASGAWAAGRPGSADNRVELAITNEVADEAEKTEQNAVVLVVNLTSTKRVVELKENIPNNSKESLRRAVSLVVDSLTTAITTCNKEHPDEGPCAAEILADQSMKNHHNILSIRVVLHPTFARALLLFLATTCQSKLEVVPRDGTSPPVSVWLYVRNGSDPRFPQGL